MEMNKYDDFSAKRVKVLLEELTIARLTSTTVNKEWYDALLHHLNIRLSEDEKKTMHHILTANLDILKTENDQLILSEKKVLQSSTTSNESHIINSEKWYDDWPGFMFTVALSVAIGMLVAAFIIYIILKNELSRSF